MSSQRSKLLVQELWNVLVDGVTVEKNLTADHQKINVPGMQGNPAEFTAAIVANSSIVALMNNDVIRPLDDLSC